jgi:hypothetical protein
MGKILDFILRWIFYLIIGPLFALLWFLNSTAPTHFFMIIPYVILSSSIYGIVSLLVWIVG